MEGDWGSGEKEREKNRLVAVIKSRGLWKSTCVVSNCVHRLPRRSV